MRQSFFGLNVAIRGLYTAQRGLDVVNHNLNNVNTPGYSRQKAVQAASRPVALYDGTGMVGTGADIVAVERTRDEYLDFKYWSETVAEGEWKAKKELLSDLESTFNEPSNSGFSKILGEFYSSLQELSKDPSSPAVRSLVREKGVTASKYFNSLAAHFEKLQEDVNDRIKTKTGEINALGSQIQQLNKQIYTAELDGNTANDLRDERTHLVDQLSSIINIEANEVISGKLPNGKDDKHFVLTISGKAFVDHFNISKLSLNQRKSGEKLNFEDVDNLYEVGWADGNPLAIRGGEIKGYLDVRDGNEGDSPDASYNGELDSSPLYKGIPYYQKKLNEFVRTFAKAFNEGFMDKNGDGSIDPSAGEDLTGHADGYKLNSNSGDLPSGIRFFTILGEDGKPVNTTKFLDGANALNDDPLTVGVNESIPDAYNKLTAKNFTVSEDILQDYNLISTADEGGTVGNIDTLNVLLEMRHDNSMFSEGSPEDFMKSLVSTLGIDSQQAVRLSDNQGIIVKQIENRRLSDSGVSIDEEMTNLVKYQHAYNAAAKVITTMNEIYDTLINRLGVG